MTNFLYHTARFVGIHVVDHLIINLIAFLSLRKVGEMQKIIEDMKFKIYDEVKPELDKLKEEEKADALKVGRKEGVAAGKMLGLAEGLIEGEAKGIDKGLIQGEKNKAIEIVKEMLAQNSEIDFIVKVTKLTIEEIKKIKKDMEK